MTNSLAENFPLYWGNKPKRHAHDFSGFCKPGRYFQYQEPEKADQVQLHSSTKVASHLWISEGSEVQFEDLPKSSNTCTEFIQTIWTLKNADMGLLRTDILVQFPLVSCFLLFQKCNKNLPLFWVWIVFCLGVLGFFFSSRGLSRARSITQKHRFTLKQSAMGTLSKLIKVWFEFPRMCMCLCTHTYTCNLFFRLYLLAHSEGTLLQLILHGPQRWESSHLVPQHVAIWTFFIKTQESSQLRNCFQYLVASRTEGNCSYPASMSAGSVCCSLSCLSEREGCCMFREQLLIQFLALLSLNHTL